MSQTLDLEVSTPFRDSANRCQPKVKLLEYSTVPSGMRGGRAGEANLDALELTSDPELITATQTILALVSNTVWPSDLAENRSV